jgi:hypothetical protein
MLLPRWSPEHLAMEHVVDEAVAMMDARFAAPAGG